MSLVDLFKVNRDLVVTFLVMLGIAFSSCELNMEKIVDKEVNRFIQQPDETFLAIGVIYKGEETIRYFTDIREHQDLGIGDNSFFEIASISKTMAGLMIANSVVNNHLQLEEDVRKYLPDVFDHFEYQGEPVRIKHLLTHTSGFASQDKIEFTDDPDIEFKNAADLSRAALGDFYKSIENTSLDTLPGSRYAYSNLGVDMLGLILEEVYGKPFEELIDSLLFKPLGMGASAINLDSVGQSRLMIGGKDKYSKRLLPTIASYSGYPVASLGVKSTVPDLLQFIKAQFHSTERNIVESHQSLYKIKENLDMSYLWFKDSLSSSQFSIFHQGKLFSTVSMVKIIPDRKFGIVVLTDYSSYRANDVERIANAITNKILPPADRSIFVELLDAFEAKPNQLSDIYSHLRKQYPQDNNFDDPVFLLKVYHYYMNRRGFQFIVSEFAANQFPDSAETNYLYAKHLDDNGDLEKTQLYISKCLNIDPNHVKAKRLLESIEHKIEIGL